MSTPLTSTQIPSEAILDQFNKQVYLGQSFITAVRNLQVGTQAETPILLLTNPVGNTKAMFLNYTRVTADDNSLFSFYFNPTVTSNGTALPIDNRRIACTNAPTGLAYKQPTVSSMGSFIELLACEVLTPDAINTLLILDPGQSLLVTVGSVTDSTTVLISSSWYEL